MTPKPECRSRRGDFLAIFPVAAAVLWFYAWTVGSGAPEPMVSPHQGDYYNLLTEGFRQGHLYLNAAVAPDQLLPPGQRPLGAVDYLLDASLYRGHYYLYFGVTPALTFFLPFSLLTGLELNQLAVVGVQAGAAFLAGLALLWVLRRHFAPQAGRGALMAATLAWGLGCALPVTLRKPHMYEVAITAGMAWSSGFLLCSVLAVLRPARSGRWLAAASCCFGLAVGSRPNLFAGGGVVLAGVCGWLAWRSYGAATWRHAQGWRWLACACVPAALIGLGLLLYNEARFNDPFEFGHRYQMGSNATAFFSLRYFWHNLRLYYLTPPASGWLFPFFAQGFEPVRPLGYLGVEPVHGQFFGLLWFGVVAAVVLVARRPWRGGASPGWAVAAILAGWFGANFLLLAATSVRANRYLLDFHPALVLGGCVLYLQTATLRSGWARRAVATAGIGGVVAVAVFNVGISFETMGRMRRVNPAGYARLERASNRLVWPLFRLTAPRFGPRALTVVFPATPSAPFEPLLTMGPPLTDVSLLVHYLEPGRAELLLGDELTSDNPIGGSRGPVFATRPGETRRLVVDVGALYPPAGHPWFGAASAADMQRRVTGVRITLDGREVLRGSERPHPVSPGQVVVGWRRPWARPLPERFSGQLHPDPAAVALDDDRAPAPGSSWGYRITVLLPKDRFGLVDPLLTTGRVTAGDAVLMRYRDEHSIEIIHDQIGGGLRGTVVVPVDYGRPQIFEVWFDPMPAGSGPPAYRLSLFLDSRPLLAETSPLLPFAYGEEALGANVIASSVGLASFGGTVLAVARADTGSISSHVIPERGARSAAVRFRLAASPDDRAQPLLVFARTDGGQGLLAVRRSASGLQLGWHDAAGWWWSRVLAGRVQDSHVVGVQWSTAARQGAPEGPARSDPTAAMVTLDGSIFRAPRPEFFDGVVAQVSGWHAPEPAPAGVAEHFTGQIESPPRAQQLLATRAATPALRHFRLAVRFPLDRPGRDEPLVTAGAAGAADGLYVRFERPGWIRIGFDHWGQGGPLSVPLPVTAGAYQVLDVDFGAGPWRQGGPAALSVSLDGRPALRDRVSFFPVPAAMVKVGANPIGLSTSDATFSGDLFPIEDMEDKP